MKALAFLIPFVVLGVATLFIAFSGGPRAAREAYLRGGGTFFRAFVVVVFIIGLGVPALILADRPVSAGGTGELRSKEISASAERGKLLFRQQCATCHSLAAVGARGVTGPNLDDIGKVTPQRILEAIENGGTGQNRMPARLLEGQEAQDVADFVAEVAGR